MKKSLKNIYKNLLNEEIVNIEKYSSGKKENEIWDITFKDEKIQSATKLSKDELTINTDESLNFDDILIIAHKYSSISPGELASFIANNQDISLRIKPDSNDPANIVGHLNAKYKSLCIGKNKSKSGIGIGELPLHLAFHTTNWANSKEPDAILQTINDEEIRISVKSFTRSSSILGGLGRGSARTGESKKDAEKIRVHIKKIKKLIGLPDQNEIDSTDIADFCAQNSSNKNLLSDLRKNLENLKKEILTEHNTSFILCWTGAEFEAVLPNELGKFGFIKFKGGRAHYCYMPSYSMQPISNRFLKKLEFQSFLEEEYSSQIQEFREKRLDPSNLEELYNFAYGDYGENESNKYFKKYIKQLKINDLRNQKNFWLFIKTAREKAASKYAKSIYLRPDKDALNRVFENIVDLYIKNPVNDSYLRKGKALKEVYSHLYSNKKVINEGGVGGHMLHPYEVLEGTPRDLINRIKQYGVSQKLIEKVDGQNLFFTVEKDGTPMFARNKQDMTHQDLIEKFTGHGAEKPFLEGGNAIVQGVQQWKNSGPEFFEQEVIETFHPVEGQKSFINFEIMHPDKPNQIKYDKRYIVFHGIVDFEYGPKGREEVYRTNKGERLQRIIRQMKPGVQSTGFILASNRTVNMNALTNVQIAGYVEQIKQIAASIGITEDQDFATGVLNSIKQKLAAAEIETNRETLLKIEDFVLYGEDIDGNTIQGKDVKKLFSKEDAKKLTALGLTSATKASRIISDTLTQFAPIFVNLGIDLLSGVKSAYMSDEFNRKNIDELREKLRVAIEDYNRYVAATPDDEQSNVAKRLKRHIDVVKDIGLENIVNSAVEGGVYDENGDLLKVTGGFAPLNQIIGAAYRDNEGIFSTFIERYRDIEKNESKKYSLKSIFNLI